MPNPPRPERIPESVDAQRSTGAPVRFCFDEPLMTGGAGLLPFHHCEGQSGRLSCTRKEGNAMRLLMIRLLDQVLDGFRGRVLAGSDLARATFGEIRLKLFNLAARVRVVKTRMEVHLASRHPDSQRLARALRVFGEPGAGGG